MPGDIVFYSGDSYFGGNLTAYVQNNTIPESRVDDMGKSQLTAVLCGQLTHIDVLATRILASWYLLHQDEGYPEVSFDFFRRSPENNTYVNVEEDHYKIVREIGAASTVLLKNTNNTLPFKSGKHSLRSVVMIGNDAGPGRAGPNQFSDQGGSDGVLAMGWGSGYVMIVFVSKTLL